MARPVSYLANLDLNPHHRRFLSGLPARRNKRELALSVNEQ